MKTSLEELKQKILEQLNLIQNDEWIANAILAANINVHPDRVKAVLLDLLLENQVERNLKNKYTYWRLNKNEVREESQENSG